MREVLKQPQYLPIRTSEQIAVLLAVVEGEMDRVPVERIAEAESVIRGAATGKAPDVCERIEKGEKFTDEDRGKLLAVIRDAVNSMDGLEENGIS